MLKAIISAVIEWLAGFLGKEIKKDTHAKDAPKIPSHIRERFDDRLREHPSPCSWIETPISFEWEKG